jgi:uncharacterized surface protein with fasciclin (FAS1) repeats
MKFNTKLRMAALLSALLVMAAVVTAGAAGRGTSAESTATKKNIVQTTVAAGQFKTLASLLTKAGLVETLSGKGPFTVFAPTDKAFKKVPKSTLAALAADKSQLKAVLLYHVASGKVPAAKVVKRSTIKTLNGASVRVKVSGKTVRVGGAKVTKTDVRASNGVIHVINEVLIPPKG